ncbi:hypothetical protein K9L67_02650 [Candidatus Woesearchaeota archaeon]|nr:hypothetical protein [Candidatus Woesearchaeota archaeon]MCF7901103.1 hypothetical protein [Candidatus Woesearchaeota archaeon]MCF8013436.1 hypothetical protein [Candidatus Woesearchaeota archaeon]
MIKNLIEDINLRGRIFETVSRILIRRHQNNNFIFQCSQFSSFEEIIKKYRLNCDKMPELKDYLQTNKIRADLIEFELNNLDERIVKKISFYDVKTRKNNSKRKYYESCVSVHKFMNEVESKFKCNNYILSILIFEDWKFSFNIYQYDEVLLRIYNSVKKKTLFFIKNGEKKYFNKES